MPVQRKVFRIEQMGAIAAPAAASAGGIGRHQQDILDELKALHELIERRGPQDLDPATIEPAGLQQLKDETDTIHRAISRTKEEIASLHVSAFTDIANPCVTRELDAVVEGTERATQQILDAAEIIEEAASALAASVKHGQEQALAQDIQEHVVRIFEACNFQDLSGQRIAKVLATMKFIEERIARMMEIWGGAEAFRDYAAKVLAEHQPPALHGPRLDGDLGHASQADVDALFAKAD